MDKEILVIDDEEIILFVFKKALSKEGVNVTTVNTFYKAVDTLHEKEFDLIFTDIKLSGKSGIDILHETKKINQTCPVIIMTGFPNIKTASESVRLGAFDYLIKPIDIEDLLDRTEKALNQRKIIEEEKKRCKNIDAVFRNVNAGIITVNKELKIIEINNTAEEMFGIVNLQIKGNLFNSLLTGCKCGAKSLEAINETIEKKHTVEINRIECKHNNQPEKIIYISTFPLINNSNIFYGCGLIIREEARKHHHKKHLKNREQYYNMIGKSAKMQKIYDLIDNFADPQTKVLVIGETGTGKELIAEALHYQSCRKNGPFIKVNCAALSDDLLQSELFGHVKGAFTGAFSNRIGMFEKANNGTIFLDEIGDISIKMQASLLRVLQNSEFNKLGDFNTIKTNSRIIAATNQNLLKKVEDGTFREDLYHRLSVIEFNLPPLRERSEDIPILTKHFLEKFNKKFDKNIKNLSYDAEKTLANYKWSGNIRELENKLEHAFLLCKDNILKLEDFPSLVTEESVRDIDMIKEGIHNGPEKIRSVLKSTGWNKSKAAQILADDRKTIYRKLKIYNIEP